MSATEPYVAVIGSGSAQTAAESLAAAEEVGRGLAEAGATLLCGGLGGVMEAACRGAAGAGGRTIGILPGGARAEGNRWLDVAIPTGLGEARNAVIARAADALIAVAGAFGTLSEIALALQMGKPVVGLRTWELAQDGHAVDAVIAVDSPRAAVERALELGER